MGTRLFLPAVMVVLAVLASQACNGHQKAVMAGGVMDPGFRVFLHTRCVLLPF